MREGLNINNSPESSRGIISVELSIIRLDRLGIMCKDIRKVRDACCMHDSSYEIHTQPQAGGGKKIAVLRFTTG